MAHVSNLIQTLVVNGFCRFVSTRLLHFQTLWAVLFLNYPVIDCSVSFSCSSYLTHTAEYGFIMQSTAGVRSHAVIH